MLALKDLAEEAGLTEADIQRTIELEPQCVRVAGSRRGPKEKLLVKHGQGSFGCRTEKISLGDLQ
jgi:hypothetical protein